MVLNEADDDIAAQLGLVDEDNKDTPDPIDGESTDDKHLIIKTKWLASELDSVFDTLNDIVLHIPELKGVHQKCLHVKHMFNFFIDNFEHYDQPEKTEIITNFEKVVKIIINTTHKRIAHNS